MSCISLQHIARYYFIWMIHHHITAKIYHVMKQPKATVEWHGKFLRAATRRESVLLTSNVPSCGMGDGMVEGEEGAGDDLDAPNLQIGIWEVASY